MGRFRFLREPRYRVAYSFDAGCFWYEILELVHTTAHLGPFFWRDSFGTFTQIIEARDGR